MAISNIIRGIGRGAMSVGRAVQAASRKLDQGVQPLPTAPVPSAPAQAPLPTAPAAPAGAAATTGGPTPAPAASSATPAPAAPKGFQLPDLGPGPDPNDPKYQDEKGKKQYESDLADYKHKQDIHQAFMDLDKVYTQAHPNRDFEKEYRDMVALQQQGQAERPRGSNLARAALALGDFNPAVRQSGRSNLDTYNQRVEEAAQQSDKGFSQRMLLRQKMHEAAAEDAQQQGNWKKALAEQEKASLLAADAASLEHKRKMEEIGAQQEGATNRAMIRRDAMENSAKIRATSVGAAHGLSGSFLSSFEKESAKAVAKLLGPRDLTKEYTPADLDSITNYVEHLAEYFHDQQYGPGSSETYLKTHPGQRKAPASKEKF